MVRELTHQELLELTKARDYRAFAGKAMKIRYGDQGTWGAYARFAKAAGFASRSTARDVLTGRKRMASGSFSKFVTGLRLTGSLREYFSWLVARDEPALNPRGWTTERIDQKLALLRERILRRAEKPDETYAEAFLGTRDRFVLFAALGTTESGASLEEISLRTQLPARRIQTALEQLESAGMIRVNEQRYYPIATHLDFDGQGGKAAFESLYRTGLEETLTRLRSRPEVLLQRDRLYFESLYAIDPSRSEEFRSRLRSLCMDFVDQSEAPHGKGLAKLLIAFEPYEPR